MFGSRPQRPQRSTRTRFELATELGDALAIGGQPAEAILVYQECLVHETDASRRAILLIKMGHCSSTLGELTQAEIYHRRAVECHPEHLGARWSLFSTLIRRRSYESALAVVEQTLALPSLETSDVDNLHAYRAEVLMALRRYPEALAAIDLSLASDPSDVARLGARARVLITLGRENAARVCIGTIVRLAPDNELARVLLERLSRTSTALKS